MAKRQANLLWQLAPIRTMCKVHVDLAAKHVLLDAYPSQLAGLKAYQMYEAPWEFVYSTNDAVAKQLSERVKCLSS